MGFETAKSGLNVAQKALDIVGNNLSNIDTAGYTRQRVHTNSLAPSAYSTRVGTSRIGLTGQGVEAIGVSQTRDAFLDKRFRDEYSTASYNSQASNILTDIQAALGDANNVSLGGDVLAQAYQQIYKALNSFTADSTSTPNANLVLSSFNNVTQVIQMLNGKLDQVLEQQNYDLEITVDRVNNVLSQIAHLNDAISRDATVVQNPDNEYFRPNELLDQRNLLLDELASYGDISITPLKDGTVNVTMGGHQVVSGREYVGINMNVDTNNQVTNLYWQDSGEVIQLSGGALLGYTDFINGRGANMQQQGETIKQGIPYYKDRLDTLARTLAGVVNSVIPDMEALDPEHPEVMTQKVDENGNLMYKQLLAAKTPDGKTDSTIPVTAANISVSDAWTQGGAEYFISETGNNINASYSEQLKNILTEGKTDFISYGETFTGNFEEYLLDYTGKIGSDTAFYNSRTTITSGVADELLDSRDAISAVSESEETVSMMTYEKSFNAISRVMTTLDDLLETLINRTGRVGL